MKAQVGTHSAEDVRTFLKSHRQVLTLDDLVEIGKQSALEEDEEAEPESKEKTVRCKDV
jgi:hypothetical protein